MATVWWTVAAMLALGVLLNVFDPEFRRDVGTVVRSIVGLPGWLVLAVVAGLSQRRGVPTAHRVSPEALRRIADRSDLYGFAVERSGRYTIVITSSREREDRP